jgi:hypothetical protein
VLEGTARNYGLSDNARTASTKPAGRGELGSWELEIRVVEPHLCTFARTEPHVAAGSAQPH